MAIPALVIGVALLASASPAIHLTVFRGVGACRPVPEGWAAPGAVVEEAEPAAVAEDIRRYFAGLSAQFTPILPAAWNGEVHFCTEDDERVVLRALVECTIRPDPDLSVTEVGLPIGSEELLQALGGPALLRELEAFEAASVAESARRTTALRVVRDIEHSVP
jgi:hypothetical protein